MRTWAFWGFEHQFASFRMNFRRFTSLPSQKIPSLAIAQFTDLHYIFIHILYVFSHNSGTILYIVCVYLYIFLISTVWQNLSYQIKRHQTPSLSSIQNLTPPLQKKQNTMAQISLLQKLVKARCFFGGKSNLMPKWYGSIFWGIALKIVVHEVWVGVI